jgi:hypothetical protein
MRHYAGSRGGKYYTPTAEWLHAILRPLFADQLVDKDLYDSEYDRAEVVLGLVAQDAANQRHLLQGINWRARTRWFGRYTWRAGRSQHSLLTDLEHQLQSEGADWPPLRHGLFGSDVARAKNALESYAADFQEIAKHRL